MSRGTRVAAAHGVASLPNIGESLRQSCERIRCDTDAVSQAARDRDTDRLLHRAGELTASVSQHVQLVDTQLSPLSQRRLQHDHHRLLQLTRAIELAAAHVDTDAARANARRLSVFIVAHLVRETAVI